MRFTTKTYNCGGYANYSGHCGARDCSTCYPGGGWEDTQLDLRDAGYEYDADDGEWSRVVRSSIHTSRKVGAKHGFEPGTRYRKTTTRYVNDATRLSYHGHRFFREVARPRIP